MYVIWKVSYSKVVVPYSVVCGVYAYVSVIEFELHAVVQQFSGDYASRSFRNSVDLFDTLCVVKVFKNWWESTEY